MKQIKRYAVYYAPPEGDFAARAEAWLGRSAQNGAVLPHPEAGFDVAEITRDPRRYGFHGTLRAPFRLAEGVSFEALNAGLTELAARLAPLNAGPLELRQIGGFWALVPAQNGVELQDFAAEIIRATEPFRAELSAQDYARRRPERLTPRQRELLDTFGYPFVMEEFRFHFTLTDRIEARPEVEAFLRQWLGPVLPEALVIGELCLFGEAEDGAFHILHRYTLSG